MRRIASKNFGSGSKGTTRNSARLHRSSRRHHTHRPLYGNHSRYYGSSYFRHRYRLRLYSGIFILMIIIARFISTVIASFIPILETGHVFVLLIVATVGIIFVQSRSSGQNTASSDFYDNSPVSCDEILQSDRSGYKTRPQPKYCDQCGTAILPKMNFCIECGNDI